MQNILPLLGVVLLGLGFSAGAILTFVGVRRKRPAMWAGGIIVCLLGGLTIYMGSVFIHAQSQRRMKASHDEWAREDIEMWTGLSLPRGVSARTHWQHSVHVQNRVKELLTYHVSVPPEFEEYLRVEFARTQWKEVDGSFAASRMHPQQSLPTDAQLQAMPLHRAVRPMPSEARNTTTAVAHDPNSRQAWIVIVSESTAP